MKISGKVLRGLIREELKRSLMSEAQVIYPEHMIVGMEPALRAPQDAARTALLDSVSGMGLTPSQIFWATGGEGWVRGVGGKPGHNAQAWKSAAELEGPTSDRARALAVGSPIEGLDDNKLSALWSAVKEADAVLASQGG